jgi:hypothetical protein
MPPRAPCSKPFRRFTGKGLQVEAPRPLVFSRPDFARKSAPDRLNMVMPPDGSSPGIEAATGAGRAFNAIVRLHIDPKP